MKGVFKIKPPKPRYCSTWNVKTALSFLESLEPLEELTLKHLCYKTGFFFISTDFSSKSSWTVGIGLDVFSQERGVMGIFAPHSCEQLQTWSPSSEVSFLGIPRESQDLCYSLSYHLCGEDKRITEIHPTISVIYFSAQGNFKLVSLSVAVKSPAYGRNWIDLHWPLD